ncbi:nuclear transport factor 2 family protein [Caballeronia ptereochthonis]|uniref:DUF4440 domain-containing protein n=1 Tax=Caballeronia ptereochthonis TaxID=1777144 RepID=A0A158C2I3_9BURK|nr:nuclear transport factor 2 family protein [Caballeronia ptereochthonis]SAK76532.1 hypothetical protein AWB83_03929 [Caballeronia ptereochthonis]
MNDERHDPEIIRQLEDARYEAMLGKDTGALMRLLDERLIYMHSSGVTDTRGSYLDGLRSGLWNYRQIGRSDVRIEVQGDVALVFGKLAIQLMSNDSLKSFETRALAVWYRRQDRWQLIAVHSGALSAAP